MSSRLRRSLKPVKKSIRRTLGIQKPEVTVISFPKSGRTWLQLMLGEYITRYYRLNVRNVIAIKQYTKHIEGIPRIRFAHDDRPQWKQPGEIKTGKSAYRHQKILLLVRDPRDILVSLFFEKTRRVPARRSDRPEFKGSIDEFVYHKTGGIDSIITFYNSWAANREVPEDFRIVKYEDLRHATRATLIEILTFIGLPEIDEGIVDQVLELGKIEKMRKREATSARGAHTLRRTDLGAGDAFETRAFQPANPDDPESFKVRKGKVGGYADYLGEKEIEFLNSRIREDLDPVFGY
ncbi:MAG: sulfotransferase domain-containing protein [Gammaproteobacteria bacterium]|jgi:hypothetical protein